MAIQSEGVKKAIQQEETRCRMTLKLDCKEAKYRTILMSMETWQRWAVEQRSVEAQYRRETEELKHQQLADWAEVWSKELLERMLHQQHIRREKIWEEEASHLEKLEAEKRRSTNSMEREQGGILTVDELEDISQYQVTMAIEPHRGRKSHRYKVCIRAAAKTTE